jgi:BON domain
VRIIRPALHYENDAAFEGSSGGKNMRKNMSKYLVLFLLPFVAMAATRPAPAPAASSPTKTATGQPRLSVSDGQLESTIRTKLAKSKIGKDGFHFHVQRGVVTWEGTTAIGQHKGAATRMARTSGAVQVVNNIRVSGTGKGTPMRKAYVEP